MVTNLKKLRIKKGLTQSQLADILLLSQQSVNKYENQGAEPDIETLKKLADLFDTSIDYIVGYTDIDRRFEKAEKYTLNTEEARLIDNYRALNKPEKVSIQCVINNYISTKK